MPINVLFLTLLDFKTLQERNIYTDLLRVFVRNGHKVYTISPTERRKRQETRLIYEDNTVILKLKVGNIQKTGLIEKGISTLMIEPLFIKAINRYFNNVKFDLVLYSTPPITFCRAVSYVKKRDNAKTYLMLKDIFPQNAVDIGLLSKSGLKSLIYKYFRNKEKKLYTISDRIGCMSSANVKYVLEHNSDIVSQKVEICPNSIEVIDRSISYNEKKNIRQEYGIPCDKKVFVYGGNLGKPQGIPFLIECIRRQKSADVFFLIIGEGTEYTKLEKFVSRYKPQNVCLMKYLPKAEYDRVTGACDVGMIFLDHRFSIPNFPSRLLGYMQAKLPVLAVTDLQTDIGQVIMSGNFGWWCESNNSYLFANIVDQIFEFDLEKMGETAFQYLKDHYNVETSYKIIMA